MPRRLGRDELAPMRRTLSPNDTLRVICRYREHGVRRRLADRTQGRGDRRLRPPRLENNFDKGNGLNNVKRPAPADQGWEA